MKKILIGLIVLISFGATGIAQVTKSVKKTEDKMKVVPQAKPTTPAKVVQLPKSLSKTHPAEKSKTTVVANPVILKNDGTPDKRYKVNNTPTRPVKKDGTRDMRYKQNKKNK